MTNWKRTITGVRPILKSLEDDTSNLDEVRDSLVSLFKTDKAFEQEGHDKFTDAVTMLEAVEDRDELDEWMAEIYDWADYEEIWIDPIK